MVGLSSSDSTYYLSTPEQSTPRLRKGLSPHLDDHRDLRPEKEVQAAAGCAKS